MEKGRSVCETSGGSKEIIRGAGRTCDPGAWDVEGSEAIMYCRMPFLGSVARQKVLGDANERETAVQLSPCNAAVLSGDG